MVLGDTPHGWRVALVPCAAAVVTPRHRPVETLPGVYSNSKVWSVPYGWSRVAPISPALNQSLTVPSKATCQSSVVLLAAASSLTASLGTARDPTGTVEPLAETALTSAVPNFWLYRLEHEWPQATLAAPATGAAAIPLRHAQPTRTSPARPATAFLIPDTIYLSFYAPGWPRYRSPEDSKLTIFLPDCRRLRNMNTGVTCWRDVRGAGRIRRPFRPTSRR